MITLITGLLFAGQYYVPHPASEQMLTLGDEVAADHRGIRALILGVTSLFHQHAVKITRQEAGWGYSLVLYAGMLGTIAVGLWADGKEAVDGTMTAFGWVYNFMMVPLQGTMFAILAFFIASAAYRSFRARSREAAVLLVAAVIVMMGRVPLGEYLIPLSGDVSSWILNVLNSSVRRAILIGVSLGAIALSFKIIFGMERPSILAEERNSGIFRCALGGTPLGAICSVWMRGNRARHDAFRTHDQDRSSDNFSDDRSLYPPP
ncbi:MAG: hypothetical protein QM706_03705 [Nitrospira sp.]